MVRKHISRKYSAHHQSVIRPMDEFFEVEILSYDHPLTTVYSFYDTDYSYLYNAEQTNRNNWSCLQSLNKTHRFEAHISFVVDEFAEYRFDCLYENKDTRNFTGFFTVTDKDENEIINEEFLCDGDTDTLKRKSFFYELKPNVYDIKFEMPVNTWLMGCVGRKIIKYVGNSLDSAGTNIMVTSASISHTDDVKPAELSMSIGYDNAFECFDSQSGFYMDYRDEINCYVRDDDGTTKQIFGGYLSSILPNDDTTSITITGVDRLSDGDKKYIMESMVLRGGTTTGEDYKNEMIHSFETYGEALKHLCDLYEESLQNNVNENYLVAGENYNEGMTATLGKNGTIKKVKTVHMISEVSDNFITIRNEGSAKNLQTAYLYDVADYSATPVDITDYPNFYITYGLGDPKTEEKQGETNG